MLRAADNILTFSLNPTRDRLTVQDKIDAMRWEVEAFCLGYDRVIIHEVQSGQRPEDNDFVLVYRLGHPWARWGAARQGRSIVLWRCSDGVQMGLFMTMKAALTTIQAVNSAFQSGALH